MDTMKLIANNDQETRTPALNVIKIANDADPLALAGQLDGVDVVELHFPKFTDGRAFSQAHLLRRRLGFAGTLRATGDVLVDQLAQMQRTGFTEAVLRADQSLTVGEKLLAHYPGFYQGDVVSAQPHFAKAA